ncbi:MAG: xanthine dehydrogenase family protein molybdopterin-binding subunit [Tepidisphaeraceae bacterium]
MPATMPTTESTTPLGKPLSRVDGRLKVTGHAQYAADTQQPNAVAAVLVCSPISKGTIKTIDATAARQAAGVIRVVVAGEDIGIGKTSNGNPMAGGGLLGEERIPLSDKEIVYAGQYIAAVVAETIDQARHAADLIRFTFETEKPVLSVRDKRADVDFRKKRDGNIISTAKGDVAAAADAIGTDGYVINPTYDTPVETHNPMELHATVAAWQGDDKLMVWDATQYVMGVRNLLASQFDLKPENVRVLSPFLGGGFGCKGAMWPHVTLAVALAKQVNRPVRLVLTRQQMFVGTGHRPACTQSMALVAGKDGKLTGLAHDSTIEGSVIGDFVEPCGNPTRITYATPNLAVRHFLNKINIAPPTFMRAPGEAPGMYALESAIDELAVAAKIDPVQLRLTNYADVSADEGKPYTSKFLKECYALGAEKFGWNKYSQTPGSMKDEQGRTIGWGVAGATYPAFRFPGTARIRLMKADDGGLRAIAGASAQDLGTGSYTAFAQMTADLVGLPIERVKFELGDTALPFSPVAGGSTQTASVGQALFDAGYALKTVLLKTANEAGITTLSTSKPEEVRFADGKLVSTKDASAAVDVRTLIDKTGRAYVEGHAGKPEAVGKENQPGNHDYTAVMQQYAPHSFGVHFVEVAVDDWSRMIHVKRVVSVMNVGRVVNPKTAESQVIGGVVMGIGMALFEQTNYDPNTGKPVNDSLADYVVATNADVPPIEVHFVGDPDLNFNAMGVRGVGEIGITGVAAAVANAVYHATGKRVRDLPITPDKLL